LPHAPAPPMLQRKRKCDCRGGVSSSSELQTSHSICSTVIGIADLSRPLPLTSRVRSSGSGDIRSVQVFDGLVAGACHAPAPHEVGLDRGPVSCRPRVCWRPDAFAHCRKNACVPAKRTRASWPVEPASRSQPLVNRQRPPANLDPGPASTFRGTTSGLASEQPRNASCIPSHQPRVPALVKPCGRGDTAEIGEVVLVAFDQALGTWRNRNSSNKHRLFVDHGP